MKRLLLFGFTVPFIILSACPARSQGIIPPECYLDQDDGAINSCKYCHTDGNAGAIRDDADKQRKYPSAENKFLNVLDPARLDAGVPPEEIPVDLSAFLNLDNYSAARVARGDAPGVDGGAGVYKYFPDLIPESTGADGFANNGWRAFKWKPSELAWPRYNGRIQQNWIRLPEKFRLDASGSRDVGIYHQNLELLVAAMRGDVTQGAYAGMAADEAVVPFRFPTGTEVTHYLYYLDPARPDLKAARIKEVRVNIKSVPDEHNRPTPGFVFGVEKEYSLAHREGEEEAAALGLIYNKDGWDFVGFIEDVDGRLRPQTNAEMTQCIGCHSARLGAIRDSHFNSLQRKLPGDAGWAVQDYRGIFDYHNAGLGRGETAEIFENYWGGAATVPGNPDGSIDFLPSPDEADALNRRYYQIVQTQSYYLGRDPKLTNPGFLVKPGGADFLEEDEVARWHPDLDFEAFEPALQVTAVEPVPAVSTPIASALRNSFPNPFNARAHITYELSARGRVTIEIHNLGGQAIRTLLDDTQSAGTWRIGWDGRDRDGRVVATGAYVCRLTHRGTTATRKMLLLR